ncbi:MAG: hypothetical protein Q4D82_04195, partial [Neisseria sp.]|nr:hypothetical protein [Neisseria sp.]
MTDRRTSEKETIEQLKRSNRRRLAGASAMVLVAGILLGKALDSDNQGEEAQTQISMASAEQNSGAPEVSLISSEPQAEAETVAEEPQNEAEQAPVPVTFTPDEEVPIDRLSDAELERIIAADAARQGQSAAEETIREVQQAVEAAE